MVQFKINSDEYGPLMDMHPHTRGKLDIIHHYYRQALPIFANQARKEGQQALIVDAFCGSGRYDDGSDGSPIVILRNWNDFLQDKSKSSSQTMVDSLVSSIVFIFNDNDKDTIESLEARIRADDDLSWLLPHIRFENKDYKDLLTDLVLQLNNYGYASYFIDPYGYIDINIDEIAGLAQAYGHEVIVNWMFENIAKYTHARDPTDLDKTHPSTLLLDDMFGDVWRKRIKAEQDLSERKEHLTLLFEEKLKQKISQHGETPYIIPFMFYKDGERIWYPMYHVCTSGRGASVFNRATMKVGGNLKKFHPTNTREDKQQTTLDSFFDDDEDGDPVTTANQHIRDNIDFFKGHLLDVFSHDSQEIMISDLRTQFLRVYPRRSPEGISNVRVSWIEIVTEALERFPDNLSVRNWDGERRLRVSDVLVYDPVIH